MPIGAYNPWIASHCTPEQAVEMANEARAQFVVPIHHQTFRLSWEPMDEPMRRLLAAAGPQSDRVAIRQIGVAWSLPAKARKDNSAVNLEETVKLKASK